MMYKKILKEKTAIKKKLTALITILITAAFIALGCGTADLLPPQDGVSVVSGDDAAVVSGDNAAVGSGDNAAVGSGDNAAVGSGDNAAVGSEDGATAANVSGATGATADSQLIDEDGIYDTKEELALYIHTYGHLPGNFITKAEAGKLGWSGGDAEPYYEDGCIGGDVFRNYEKLLPEGFEYYECDVGTLGVKGRGAQRLIYTESGIVYYTSDHYESFTQLYGEREQH